MRYVALMLAGFALLAAVTSLSADEGKPDSLQARVTALEAQVTNLRRQSDASQRQTQFVFDLASRIGSDKDLWDGVAEDRKLQLLGAALCSGLGWAQCPHPSTWTWDKSHSDQVLADLRRSLIGVPPKQGSGAAPR